MTPQARVLIDLNAVARNYQTLSQLSGSAETSAVVKANAYGLGVHRIAPVLKEAGCKTFFVATLPEAVVLREIVGQGPTIHVFEGYWDAYTERYARHDLTPVLNTLDQARAWKGSSRCIHFDTGINRLGIPVSDVEEIIRIPGMSDAELVMSHLACADDASSAMNARQLASFKDITHHFNSAQLSLSNTGGILLGEDYHFDLTRPGIGLYGGHPARSVPSPFSPVVTVEAPVLQIRQVNPGDSLGYGATLTAENTMITATLGVGYADGIIRASSNQGHVTLGSETFPIVGIVSMDLLTIDITRAQTALKPGDRVNILGLLLDEFAESSGTIGYEILTRLGDRLEKVYVD